MKDGALIVRRGKRALAAISARTCLSQPVLSKAAAAPENLIAMSHRADMIQVETGH